MTMPDPSPVEKLKAAIENKRDDGRIYSLSVQQAAWRNAIEAVLALPEWADIETTPDSTLPAQDDVTVRVWNAAVAELEAQPPVEDDRLVAELRAIAAWIRTPGNINPDDARDECARVLENRAAALTPAAKEGK